MSSRSRALSLPSLLVVGALVRLRLVLGLWLGFRQ